MLLMLLHYLAKRGNTKITFLTQMLYQCIARIQPVTPSLWPPYGIGQAIIFLPCDFYLLSIFFFFFPSPISAVGDWMSTILPHMVWCGLSANLECMSEMCCTRLAENTGHKKIAILAPSHNFVGLCLRS